MNYKASAITGQIRAELARKLVDSSEVASWLCISEATVRRRLTGSHPFTLGEIQILAEHLGVKVSDLYARAEQAMAS